MKFMKLGSRPDTFYTAEAVRSVSSEVSSDLIIQVKGNRYLLHKFPLLSKCLRLQRICSECPETLQHQIIQLPDFPGGIEAFELCAKFCYGITITLSAYNIVAARCAAEYLQMTEDIEKGNLVYKLEVFFNSCILHGWKDSIVTLQSTKGYPLWSEDLGITSRCIEAIASKVSTHPSKVSLSRSQSRRVRDDISCNGEESQRHKPTTKGWWAEDMAELGIDLYWRTMIAVKSGGKIPSNLIGEALQIFASRWLPNISRHVKANKGAASDSDSDSASEATSKQRLLLESIVSLLPSEKGAVSCSFLLKLLKAANILNASSSSKMELARRAALQLEEARVSDLLIPSLSYSSDTLYDVDIALTILEQFMLQGQSPPTSPPRSKLGFERRRRSRSAENIDFEFQESRRSSSASHSAKLKVAKIVDGYLQEIARDINLPLSKFIAIAETIPDFSRLDHDDLYRAIDIYLKAHPNLNKSERKKLCRILDCKKLSVEACMHAAQNEKLPLRVVVQVLFFEQARAATAGGKVTELPTNIKALLASHKIDPSRPPGPLSTTTSIPADEQWSVSGLKSPKSRISTLRMKLDEDDDLDENDMNPDGMGRSSKFKAFCALPTKPKKMFSKLLSINRSASEKN
ncbi:BTB/POZ domain-containing protein At1g67900-like [Durio zibethinus]|uniref:BTB/POZ domain-containing protein At1g67900-like n=1 Tax=Durio zibethinus TaxID=66656 RepID=A0A6P5Y5B6_DURZI|nr:BTB/POZ domain-containing protein At1g67900-like [Durio zibethinus]XP_022735212.1 BTB/POZ domain-containing protein At1g67900-like [Durio zibethinus]XP_022735213.1 BTB/POZ domain-containing protein At1g67900-like [Durio zibethinus]XP_022735214.1 BTB/POZ domain-containing protein At1g67900-like [Durio zibethinus]